MPGLVRYGLLLVLLPVLVVPLDFVSAGPWARTAVALSAGTGWLVLLVLALKRRPWAAPVLVATAGSLLLTSVVSGGATSTAVTYGALAAGFSTGALLRGGQRLLATLFGLSVLVLVLELAVSRHLFLELLGTPLFEYYAGVDFRSRGVQGHPVPAAFAAVALAIALWRAPAGSGPVLPRPLLAAGAVAALAATGTRSALVVGALLLVLSATRRHRTTVVLGGVVTLWSVGVVAVVARLQDAAGGELPRFLDFGAVRGSESFSIRASGFEVLSDLGTGCGLPCVVAGNGDRALQSAVPTVRAAAGPATVDNQYLTAFYDHGVVAVVLLALLVLAVYRVLHQPAVDPHHRSAALAVLCLLLGGLFFDALYVKTVMCLIGVLVAVAAEAPSSPGEDDRDDHPSPVGVPGDLRGRSGAPAPLR